MPPCTLRTDTPHRTDHPSHRQRRQAHQQGPGHQRIPFALLPSGLLRLTRGGAHPCLRHQPAYLDCWYRGVWNVEHEVLFEWWAVGRNRRWVSLSSSKKWPRYSYIFVHEIDGANIEIAEEVGEDNVCEYCGVIFGRIDWYTDHLTISSLLRSLDPRCRGSSLPAYLPPRPC